MLPFASMDTLLRWLPYAKSARGEVAALLEMAADDYATRTSPPRQLALALVAMASSDMVPSCTIAASENAVSVRVGRLMEPGRTSAVVAGIALICAIVTLGLPFAVLL
jgi:hypothetical protein